MSTPSEDIARLDPYERSGDGLDFRLMLAGLALSWAWTSLIAAHLMAEARSRTANRSLRTQADVSGRGAGSPAVPNHQ